MLECPYLETLEKQLSYSFRNKELLKQALVHKSFLNEHLELGLESSGRLAWLGDSVLDLVAAHHPYKKEPGDRGHLTELWKGIQAIRGWQRQRGGSN